MSGGGPIDGGDEGWPIPEHHFDDYGRTKAEAERLVLGANGKEGLYTCALRVANIWGPGDPILVPRFVGMARRGPLVGLGDGRSLYSFVYIDHAVRAHLLAAVALGGAAPAGGEAFFIVDEPPVNFFRFFTPILEAVGLRARWWFVPAGLVWPIARVSEAANRRNLTGDRPPALTRFTVSSVSQHFWFRGEKAARILGHRPTITHATAVAVTARWVREVLLPAGG
jgi:nucleoside-diphosphate-sugar epimerase